MWESNFDIKVYKESDGTFYAEVVGLPGCFTVAEKYEDIEENINEAVLCYIEGIQKDLKKKKVLFRYQKEYA